ncbi:anti-sigma B factor antagonist [Palleronia aestuarii]|uniref:Anti-sigma factor antagonist n=1 Tax=Palleronia aestuarii TaxID=568105 RepID=A0A2W7QAP6_9RHOB|nr:STAS domain-containing protein [Palleronia aestuarii]PZX18829.1 anti-sigma B factor antagonist [Palleronia aestuarii]
MLIETFRSEEATLVHVLEERIDAAVAVQFKDAMRDLASEGNRRVILDLSCVQFLDSSGLGAVIGAMKQMPPDAKMELAAMTPAVAKVFRLTRMDSIFTIHETVPPSVLGSPDTAHA